MTSTPESGSARVAASKDEAEIANRRGEKHHRRSH